MGLKSRISCVSIICSVVISAACLGLAGFVSPDRQGETAVAAFEASGASFLRLQLNGWTTVKNSFTSDGDITKFFNRRVRELFPDGQSPIVRRTYDHGNTNYLAEGLVEPGLQARYSLVVTNPGHSKNVCEILSLSTSKQTKPYKKMSGILQSIIGKKNNHQSTVIAGYIHGNLSRDQVNQKTAKMVADSYTTGVDVISDGQMVSITGYTPKVREQLTAGKKLVNINMSFRYNSVEKKTFVYVGSPLITSEY